MRKFPMQVLLAIAIAAGAAVPSVDATAAEQTSCYGGAVPAPQVSRQTIVLIDNTTAPDADVTEAFVRAASRAAATPGQRFVVLSFSALGPGQALRKHVDRVIEAPITDTDLVENLPIKPYRTSQRCVKTVVAEWPRRAEAAIREVIDGVGDRTRFKRSEIIYTVAEVLAVFGPSDMRESHLFVLSDGHEHGSVGVDMLGRDGKPRSIDARVELGRLPREVLSRRAGNGTWQVMWFGLMNEGKERQDRHVDVQSFKQMRSFWELLLVQHWGVSSAVIDRIPIASADAPERLQIDVGPDSWRHAAGASRPAILTGHLRPSDRATASRLVRRD